jgi:hypothetical protein
MDGAIVEGSADNGNAKAAPGDGKEDKKTSEPIA